MKRTAEGFLFDLHEGPDAVVLWLYPDHGPWLRLEADFYPTVYALAERARLCALGEALTQDGLIGSFHRTERIEFWSGKTREVGAYTVHHYEAHRRVVSRLEAAFGESALYNADLPIP